MMTNALTALTLGDSLHVDGNHDGAIESYTAAICMTDSRRIVKQQQQQADADTAATTTQNSKNNQAETKLIRFRSLSHRSESYLALSKYPHAYNDALAALALFPPSDIADSVNSTTTDSTSTSTSSLRPSEICLTRDRIARASFGLASQSMGIGGRSKSSGRVAFVKLSSPQMGDSGEMAEEAKEHWEGALALAGIMAAEEVDDDGEVNEKDGEENKNEKDKKGRTAAEGRRLVERFRKSLKKLEGGDDSDGEEEKKKEEEAKKEPSVNANPLSGMMDSMMESKNKADKSGGDFNANLAGKLSSPAKASKPPPSSSSSSTTTRSSSSSSAPPSKKPSNHPASAHKTSPVTRGVMSGMPKYQYYQDDNFMKVQILEPNVKPENLTTIFTPDELTIKIKKTESNGKTEEYTVIYGDLYEEVDPSKCRAIIKSEKVLVKLKKKETKLEWQKLLDESKAGDRKKGRVEKRIADEGISDGGGATTDGESKTDGSSSDNNNGNNDSNNNNNETIPTIDPKKNRPYASHRDWDAIDRNLAQAEAAEKPEGDEALNSLFAQIYKNANEDTKRAMVKSMQTSGGTCLSTNWDEVEKKDYEKEREAPKGMEWKDYEGRKLPMKEDED